MYAELLTFKFFPQIFGFDGYHGANHEPPFLGRQGQDGQGQWLARTTLRRMGMYNRGRWSLLAQVVAVLVGLDRKCDGFVGSPRLPVSTNRLLESTSAPGSSRGTRRSQHQELQCLTPIPRCVTVFLFLDQHAEGVWTVVSREYFKHERRQL